MGISSDSKIKSLAHALPRLSGDIDLPRLPLDDRTASLAGISAGGAGNSHPEARS